MRRRDDVLLVDGYNMIGAWPELEALKQQGLEEARDRLLDLLADYRGFTGLIVYVIFDAHQVAGLGGTYKQNNLIVVYTKGKETADECIERLAGQLAMRGRNIYVATSDLVEQHVAFGKGALRLSARELMREVKENRKQIGTVIRAETPGKRNSLDSHMDLDTKAKLERMRRGESDM